MLRNDKILKQITGMMLYNTKNSTILNYPRLTDFNNDDLEDSDEHGDEHGDTVTNEPKKSINFTDEINKVYYRGFCKLNVNYPHFKKANVLYYKIQIINNFPVLLFKLYKNNDKLDFHKISQSVDERTSFMGHFTTNNQIILFYNVDDHENPDELIHDEYYWVTPSELINRRQVFHFPISDEVCDFFLQYKEFLYIETEEKEVYESPEIGYQNGISELQFMLGPILSKIENHYQYDYAPHTTINVGRDLILKIDSFTSDKTFGIQNLNQRTPLAYLSR